MAETMNRFLDLFHHETPPPPGAIYADNRSELFPDVVSTSSRLELWHHDQAVPANGTFLLIGVSTWSGYDMKLLDEVEAAHELPDVIGVFDTQEARSPDDFAKRIPGLVGVMQGPVVGLWSNGRLIASGSGRHAQQIVFEACHLPVNELTTRLDWAKVASAS